MYRALAIKELREIGLMGALCSLCMLVVVLGQMSLEFDWSRLTVVSLLRTQPQFAHPVPFVDDSLDGWVVLCGGGLALVLGGWQTLGETFRKTWSFLWHRPMKRPLIVATKLATGLAVLAVSLGVPLLILAVWAAAPGTHPSPFEWWMTEHIGRLAFALTPIYLAAFLCGMRDARWYGSRLLPLGAAAIVLGFVFIAQWWPLAGWGVALAADAMLLAGILQVARERDVA
jgi:hypothetical protein